MNKKVIGLILAAGKSERMGEPKALLPILGKTFLEHIVKKINQSRLIGCRIVVGHHAKNILNCLPKLKSILVVNSEYEEGQLSSLRKGIHSISDLELDGLMVFLVDHPFVDHHLINALLHEFNNNETSIVIPSFQNKRGHPVIFGKDLFKELRESPLKEGARQVLQKYHEDITYLKWKSEKFLFDIDTPQLYQEYVR